MKYNEMIEILGKKGSVFGLDSIRNLLARLGNPQEDVPCIHVAGTNGKGSVCAFLARIIREGGYKVGWFLSPTIDCYEERFQSEGHYIDQATLQRLYEKVWEACTGGDLPTLFEAETAVFFLYMKEERVDAALVECGMGGSLDATNVIRQPLLSIITSISFDHMSFLGDSLPLIASQKAGIIKEGCPVLLSENVPEVYEVIKRTADKKQAPFYAVKACDYTVLEEGPYKSTFSWNGIVFETALPGRHQISNAVAALSAAKMLQEHFPLSDHDLKEGLKKTRWPGRLEVIGHNPLTYLDGAHNTDAALRLRDFVEKHFTNKRIIYIMGILKDKEYEKIVSVLAPSAWCFYVFTPPNERGLSEDILAGLIERRGKDVYRCGSVNNGLRMARVRARPEDVLFVCGSLSFMEELKSAAAEYVQEEGGRKKKDEDQESDF